MRVKVIVVGCSPAWPNPGGAQSGYLVEDDGRLLLDCGPGVLARLRATDGWPRIDALAITHFHLDHWGDLVPWIFGAAFGPGRDAPKPALWLPPDGTKRLRDHGARMSFGGQIDDAFDVREYEDDVSFEAAGLTSRATGCSSSTSTAPSSRRTRRPRASSAANARS